MSCNNKTVCTQKTCGCPIPDLSARCVIYDGESLSCIGADIPDNLNNLLKKFDKAICEKLDFALEKGDLKNVGTGIEFYKGENNLGEKEIRTLVSSDGSITIELDQEEETVDLKIDLFDLENESTTSDANILSSFNAQDNKYTFKGLKSDSITISEDQDGNIILEVATGSDTTISSQDNSITVVQNGDNYDLSVEEQVQADVLEQDPQELSFIQNQNPTKVIANNYTLQEADNNYVILADSTDNSILITIPPTGLPSDNFFVGFLQKGSNPVSFNGYDIKPSQFTDELQGEGHNAAVEIIQGESFLLGALTEQP